MNKEKMYALNTPTTEMQFELMLIANGKPDELENLVAQGWGIYPTVLNALIACGYVTHVHKILQKVEGYENYPVDEMQQWMQAYYEQNWKHQVVEFGMQKIAQKFFTYEECQKTAFTDALKNKIEQSPWAAFANSEGIDTVKATYLRMCNDLNQGSPARDKEQIKEIEYFLCYRGEYEFLYNRQCWQGLSSTLGGVKYIAETKHYMNGLAECVLSYHSEMLPEVLAYCIETLNNARLDDNYRPRYQEWKQRYNTQN